MIAVVDRVVQYSHRYQLRNVVTGEILGTFDLNPILGTVQVEGTKINKELFDSIANDIAAKITANGGELKDTIVTFEDYAGSENIISGEKASIMMAKIKKKLSDHDSFIATKGKANGLASLDSSGKVVQVANKADADGSGNNIANTYATKNALNGKLGKNEKATDSSKLNGETKSDIIKGLVTETQLNNSNGSVSNTTGVPSVTVSRNEKGGFNFAFKNVKGDTGPQGEPGKPAVNKRVRIFRGFNSRKVTLTQSAANFDYLEVQIRVTGSWYRLPALILTSGSPTGMVAASDEENSPKSIYLARATVVDNYTIELKTIGYARIDNGAFTGRLGNADYGIMAVYGVIAG